MRHLQENTRLLELYIGKVHEELKMRIKFCKQKVSEHDLVNMLLEYVDHESSLLPDKENAPTSNLASPLCAQLLQKTQEIEALKEQMGVEAELTRQFFKQLRREAVAEPALRLSFRESNRSELSMSPSPMLSSIGPFSTNAFDPFGDAHDQVLASPKQSAETTANRESGRASRITDRCRESRAVESEREKSKTFARLRKVEAMFCGERKAVSRKKSVGESCWGPAESKGMAEENQSLKAIQNNLVTHLSIMERYKNVASIEEVVQREERLRRKEVELKELERALERKERHLNNSQIDLLKKQKSIKML